MDYVIRWARQDEWDKAMDMVWSTFLQFDARDCSPEGQRSFWDFISNEGLKEAFLKGSYQLLVAVNGEEIIGVGSIRSRNHLSLLFVKAQYHMQGVGRALVEKLCSYLKNEAGEHYMSLLASSCAVDFYKKLGFSKVQPQISAPGIPVVLMEKFF